MVCKNGLHLEARLTIAKKLPAVIIIQDLHNLFFLNINQKKKKCLDNRTSCSKIHSVTFASYIVICLFTDIYETYLRLDNTVRVA